MTNYQSCWDGAKASFVLKTVPLYLNSTMTEELKMLQDDNKRVHISANDSRIQCIFCQNVINSAKIYKGQNSQNLKI